MRFVRMALLTVTCSLLLASTVGAQAFTRKPLRIGIVLTTTPLSEMAGPKPIHPLTRGFVERLRELGYVEGQTIVIERRSAEGRFERFDDIIAELLRLDVSAIVTTGDAMTQRARKLTATVPIVMAVGWAPVQEGLVASLARPGGNVTGLTVDAGHEIEAKRLALLTEAIPNVSRVALLGMSADWDIFDAVLKDAAAAVRIGLLRAEHQPNDYANAFNVITRERADALFVVKNTPNYAQRQKIIEFAARRRLPATYPTTEFVRDGGLMAYGISVVDLYRQAAGYVDRILKGAKPSELPVERPTKFELAINLKAARSLGVTIAAPVLARADHIIE